MRRIAVVRAGAIERHIIPAELVLGETTAPPS